MNEVAAGLLTNASVIIGKVPNSETHPKLQPVVPNLFTSAISTLQLV